MKKIYKYKHVNIDIVQTEFYNEANLNERSGARCMLRIVF